MSEQNSNLAEIQKHREQIDAIDRELVALLNKRAGHSLVIRGLKPGAHLGLYDAKREEEIFAKLDAMSAFAAEDEAAAKAVIDADDAVDYDFNTIKRMLAAEIAADPGKVDAALDVLMVIKYLERIGDHAVNIAEWVEFLRTGRYHHEKMF